MTITSIRGFFTFLADLAYCAAVAAASYAPWDRASLIRGMSDVWVISTMAFTSIKGLKADMVVN